MNFNMLIFIVLMGWILVLLLGEHRLKDEINNLQERVNFLEAR